jgi:hypothetical protein
MENSKEPCIICFEENKEKILFDCNHSTCLVCYSKLLENVNNVSCPVCREKIDNLAKVIYIPILNSPEPIPDNRMRLIGILCFLSVIVPSLMFIILLPKIIDML